MLFSQSDYIFSKFFKTLHHFTKHPDVVSHLLIAWVKRTFLYLYFYDMDENYLVLMLSLPAFWKSRLLYWYSKLGNEKLKVIIVTASYFVSSAWILLFWKSVLSSEIKWFWFQPFNSIFLFALSFFYVQC